MGIRLSIAHCRQPASFTEFGTFIAPSPVALGCAKCTESRKILAEPPPGTRSTPPALRQSFCAIQHIYLILSGKLMRSLSASQRDAKWLRLEEKLSAQPTDEVSRWVHLNFMKKVIAAQNISFNDTFCAAGCFIMSIMFHPSRHLIRQLALPPSPQRGRHCSRYFVRNELFFPLSRAARSNRNVT